MKTLPERIMEAVNAAEAKHGVQGIADACGVSVQSVYDWRKGKTKHLKGETLVELAEISGYSARWIINNKGPKLGHTEEEKLILRAFSLFGEESRSGWLSQARARIELDDSQRKQAA